MRVMVLLSLLINVAVLVPVSAVLLFDPARAAAAFGDPSPARGILLAIYVAILAVSAWLLIARNAMLVAPLLLVQVVYKLTTPLTVGSLANPVVISNLAIAAVHLVTLVLILRHLRGQGRMSAAA